MALIVVAALALGLSVQLAMVSGFEHRAAQQRAFDALREELAKGTAPVAQADRAGHPRRLGTPMALLQIPSIGLHQVVLEGTTGGVLMSGPGLSRSAAMPGQSGTSVIYGRQASYGGPFGRLDNLRKGQRITVITGEGTSQFRVLDLRQGGDPAPPPPASGTGRLLLVTASGTPFVPSGVLRVDANLVSRTLAGSPTTVSGAATEHSEAVMAGDPSTLWALVLWLQALVLVAAGAVLSWNRRGRYQTWIVFLPPLLLLSCLLANQFSKLLPNLL